MSRYRIIKGYKIDRLLLFFFFSPVFIILPFSLVYSFVNGFQGVGCPAGSMPCINPYYGLCDDYGLCGLDILPPGYSYNNPPWFISDIMILPLLCLAVAFFVVNHRLYNRGWDFGL